MSENENGKLISIQLTTKTTSSTNDNDDDADYVRVREIISRWLFGNSDIHLEIIKWIKIDERRREEGGEGVEWVNCYNRKV